MYIGTRERGNARQKSRNVGTLNAKAFRNARTGISENISNLYLYSPRRESGYCAIEWSSPNNTQSVNGSAGYFTLSGLAQTAALTQADAKVIVF